MWFFKYMQKRASEGTMKFRQGRDMPDEINEHPVIDVIYNEMNFGLISLFHDIDIDKYKMDCIIYPIEDQLTPTHVWIYGIIQGSEKPISMKIPKMTTFGHARMIARELAEKNANQVEETWGITDDEINSLFNP